MLKNRNYSQWKKWAAIATGVTSCGERKQTKFPSLNGLRKGRPPVSQAPFYHTLAQWAEEGTNAINAANNRSPLGLPCMSPPVGA